MNAHDVDILALIIWAAMFWRWCAAFYAQLNRIIALLEKGK
jgi:hypothetical protein